jgi:hypothetical protein
MKTHVPELKTHVIEGLMMLWQPQKSKKGEFWLKKMVGRVQKMQDFVREQVSVAAEESETPSCGYA